MGFVWSARRFPTAANLGFLDQEPLFFLSNTSFILTRLSEPRFRLTASQKIWYTLIDVSKEVGLEVNVEKTKYMLVSRDQNAGQHREIKIENRSFENVSQFKYLGTTVTNQNLIQEEI
jgi:hypothetical protein